ncbi:CCA tRNA nucleotidyltransferase [Acanthopleuribacter pedis]|uniref:CCA tRNA nucleotidyltransferase n=1 Tax=Acanthopleuribacter pedis TaxID=442870 RepID=A0A8J7QIG1_9BACT|nr:CCA tRNA nucleotidyltransferase [Acanthopleuribacter pedis]MBO1318835.1 CCA tRNA nucleotidyltransferase [Acanthopleuribacter pedis]
MDSFTEDHREALALCRALSEAGYPAMLAGGCVRDLLLGRTPKDFDIACAAPPETTMVLCKARGFRVVPVGIEHGTVCVVTPRQTIEVTTLREDVVCHGRHAEVAFTTDFAKDATRRDFTINALYQDADGTIHDFVAGRPDLAAKRLRFVGEAQDRIHEDYLRILRYFRFLARFGWQAEPDQLQAVTASVTGLRQLSFERIHKEMDELLKAPRAAAVLRLMNQSKVLVTLMPELHESKLDNAINHFEHCRPLSVDAAWFLLLALGGMPLAAKALPERLQELRFTRAQMKTIKTASRITHHHGNPAVVAEGVFQLLKTTAMKPDEMIRIVRGVPLLWHPDSHEWVIALINGFVAKEEPKIPKQRLLALPAPSRGTAVLATKIHWYLGRLNDKNQIERFFQQEQPPQPPAAWSDLSSP